MNPLNGDIVLQNMVKDIVKNNSIDVIIETGTHVGWSTGFFSDLVPNVITTEISKEWQDKAKLALNTKTNIEFLLGDSASTLKDALPKLDGKRVLYFLDSHFNNDLSLDRELKLIEESKTIPYIMIHDFKVPNRPDLGYDSWDGKVYGIESFKSQIEQVYKSHGCRGYQISYNSNSESGQRGCVITEPII